MFPGLLDALTAAPHPLVVLVAGLLALLEASTFVGLVVPGEAGVLLAGAVTAGDGPPLPLVIAVVAAGSVLGDSLGCLLGRRLGPRLRSSCPGRRIGPDRWAAADRAVTGVGGRTVALARFVGVAHALTPAAAGTAGMPYRRFLAASAAGSTLWATAYVVAGRVAGGSWGPLDGRLRLALPAAAITVLVGCALLLWWRSRRAAAAPAASGAGGTVGNRPRWSSSKPRPACTSTDRTPSVVAVTRAGRIGFQRPPPWFPDPRGLRLRAGRIVRT